MHRYNTVYMRRAGFFYRMPHGFTNAHTVSVQVPPRRDLPNLRNSIFVDTVRWLLSVELARGAVSGYVSSSVQRPWIH